MRVEDIAVSQGSACPERFEGFRDIEPECAVLQPFDDIRVLFAAKILRR